MDFDEHTKKYNEWTVAEQTTSEDTSLQGFLWKSIKKYDPASTHFL